MRRALSIELRGRRVEIEYSLVGSDRSVGIVSEGFEDETITDESTGELLAWELSPDECALISQRVADAVGDA